MLVVDESYMTTRSSVFAAGDVASCEKTVVYAVEAAKNAGFIPPDVYNAKTNEILSRM